MFHETGAHGPFVLGSVALSTTVQLYGDATLLDSAQRFRTEAFFSRVQATL